MKIVFLGGGNMANALIGGMVKQGFAASDIDVIDLGADARTKLSESYGVICHASAETAPASPDILVLAVKPQQMKEAVAPLVDKLGNALVISIAAGLDMAALSRWLGGHRTIVRCMPNTPALIGAGVTGLYADPSVDAAGRAAAERILAAVGYAGVADLDVSKIDVFLGEVCIASKGGRAASYTEEQGAAVMAEAEITIRIELGRGDCSETIWTTDLSHEYVKINAEDLKVHFERQDDLEVLEVKIELPDAGSK